MILNINLDPHIIRFGNEFGISYYGLMISIGLYFFSVLSFSHLKKYFKKINKEEFSLIFNYGFFGAILGGRLLCFLNEPEFNFYEFLSFWKGGFSILGAVLGGLISLIYILRKEKYNIQLFLSIISIYLPLAQCFGRIGCLLVGCCHGSDKINSIFSVVYTNINSLAENNIVFCPTQLYSALIYFTIFIVLRFLVSEKKIDKIYFYYLIGLSLERLLVDFMRGDRQIFPYFNNSFFSVSTHQCVAIFIIFTNFLFIYFSQTKIKNKA